MWLYGGFSFLVGPIHESNPSLVFCIDLTRHWFSKFIQSSARFWSTKKLKPSGVTCVLSNWASVNIATRISSWTSPVIDRGTHWWEGANEAGDARLCDAVSKMPLHRQRMITGDSRKAPARCFGNNATTNGCLVPPSPRVHVIDVFATNAFQN